VRLAALVCVGTAAAAGAQVPSKRSSDAASSPRVSARSAAVSAPESFPALQRRLADAMARGDLAGAVAIAERQHELFPDEMKATADLGGVYLARGDSERAEPLLRAAITQPSRHYRGLVAPVAAKLYASLGEIALAKGRPREAIPSLQRAADYAPTAARVRFMLASACEAAGEVERSTREIRAAFHADGSAARADDFVLLARALERSGNELGAAQAFEAALARFPLDVGLRLERAAMMRSRGRPSAALLDLVYARMLAHAGDARLAEIADRIGELRAEVSSPRRDAKLSATISHLDDAASGRHDEALRTIREVVDAEPRSFVARLLLSRSCAATGRLLEAERTLAELTAEDPSSVPALAELAAVMYAQGRRDAARRLVERARQLDAGNARLREVIAAWAE
jgi:tetratricopeptide (TPR) repeat protein